MTPNPYQTPSSEVRNDVDGEIIFAVRLPFKIMAFGLGLGCLFVCFKMLLDLITHMNIYSLIILLPLICLSYGLFWVTITGAPKLSTKEKEN